MIVFYTKDKHTVLGWCRRNANTVIDSNGVKSDDLVMRGVDWNKVEYKEYADQQIERKLDDEGNEIPLILEELKLRDFTTTELKANENLKRDIYAELDELSSRIAILEK